MSLFDGCTGNIRDPDPPPPSQEDGTTSSSKADPRWPRGSQDAHDSHAGTTSLHANHRADRHPLLPLLLPELLRALLLPGLGAADIQHQLWLLTGTVRTGLYWNRRGLHYRCCGIDHPRRIHDGQASRAAARRGSTSRTNACGRDGGQSPDAGGIILVCLDLTAGHSLDK